MKKFLFYSLVIAAVSWAAYKTSFSFYYYFMVFVPGFIYRTMHPVTPYRYVELGHVVQPSPYQTAVGVSSGIKRQRPNIIMIVADDLAINDLSGGGGCLTPNIDSIAHNGVTFVNSYAGQATCAPSRASLYTGRYPTRFGFEFTPVTKILAKMLSLPKYNAVYFPLFHEDRAKDVPPMTHMVVPRNQTMIAEMLQDEGYLTYFLGKWHIGETPGYRPNERGFTESLCFLMGASQYLSRYNKTLISADLAKNMFIDDFLRVNLPFGVTFNTEPDHAPNEYMTDYLSKAVVKLIHNRHMYNEESKKTRKLSSEWAAVETVVSEIVKEQCEDGVCEGLPQADTDGAPINTQGAKEEPVPEVAEETQPFFVTVAYNAPHNPMQALHGDFYSAELNATFDTPGKPYMPRGATKELDEGMLHTARVYAAMIMSMDRGVGWILDALKETDQLNNTLVIFTSDNGGASYLGLSDLNYPYRGFKASFFEGGIRVPMFMQWPDVISTSNEGDVPGELKELSQLKDRLAVNDKTETFTGVPITPLPPVRGQIVTKISASHVDIFATIQAAAFTDAPHTFEIEEENEEVEGGGEMAEKEGEEEEAPLFSYDGEISLKTALKKSEHFLVRLGNKLYHSVSIISHHTMAYWLESLHNQGLSADGNVCDSATQHVMFPRIHRAVHRLTKHVTQYERVKRVVNIVHDHVVHLEETDEDNSTNNTTSKTNTTKTSAPKSAVAGEHNREHTHGTLSKEQQIIESATSLPPDTSIMIDGINLLDHVRTVQSDSAERTRRLSHTLHAEQGDDEQIAAAALKLVPHSHLLANNVSIFSRLLFWRSGHYSALLQSSSLFKIQVSEVRPNKVWMYNLENDTTEVYNLALDQLNITTTDEVERARECHARLTSSELKKSTPTSFEVEMLNCDQFSDFLTLPVEPVAETQTFTDILNNTVTLTVTNTDKHHTLMKLIELYTEITTLNAQQSKPLWPALMEFPNLIDKNAMLDEVIGDEYIYWAN